MACLSRVCRRQGCCPGEADATGTQVEHLRGSRGRKGTEGGTAKLVVQVPRRRVDVIGTQVQHLRGSRACKGMEGGASKLAV